MWLVFSIGGSTYQKKSSGGRVRGFFNKNENKPHAITPRNSTFFPLKNSKFKQNI
jgi:hypothetical protein